MTKYSAEGADAHQQKLIDSLDDHDPDTGETVKEAKNRHAWADAEARAEYLEMYGLI